MKRSDEAIKKDIVESIYWDTRVDASNVQVAVDDGHVRLKGQVPTALARSSAHVDAELVSGVKSVNDDLRIEYTPIQPIRSELDLESSIRNTLEWDPNLDITDLAISIDSGWVTLEGTVDSYWKKIRAEESAADLVGVVGVTNKIAVVPSRDILDKVVADDIISALDRTLSVDINSIDVAVEDGVVTLSGTVPSLSSARAAENIAAYTSGVVDVKDNLMIGEG